VAVDLLSDASAKWLAAWDATTGELEFIGPK
jgi:hypothetical protein